MSLETLIRQAKPDYIHADSEKVTSAVFERLQNMPKTHRHRRIRARTIGLIATPAAVLGFCVIGSGFVSPVMAKALHHIPIVGSLFSEIGDEGLKTASRQGLITNVKATVTHDGITFSISEFLYDGARLSMVLTRQTSDGKNESIKEWWDQVKHGENLKTIRYLVDDKDVDLISTTISPGRKDADNAAILSVEHANLPDEFKLGVIVWDEKLKRDFTLTFPVKKSTLNNNIVLTAEKSKSHDDIIMNIKELEITTVTMRLEVNLNGKLGQDIEKIGDAMHYDIVNEQGEIAGAMSGYGDGSGDAYFNSSTYMPFPTVPNSVSIKPYIFTGKKKIYIPEFEFTLPVNK